MQVKDIWKEHALSLSTGTLVKNHIFSLIKELLEEFTDFHVHLQDDAFRDDLPEVLSRARDVGVSRFVCNGTHPGDWQSVLNLACAHANIIPCLGLHPWFLTEFSRTTEIDKALAELSELTIRSLHKTEKIQEHEKFVPGIGEIGLDRALRQRNDALQEYTFERQLDIALNLNLPVMLHTVRSVAEVLGALQKKTPILFILHGFVGGDAEIKAFTKLEGFFSVSAAVLQPSNRRVLSTVSRLPLDRILLESDAPAFPPQQNDISCRLPCVLRRLPNGKLRNEPCVLPLIIKRLSEIRGLPIEDMANQVRKNSEAFLKQWPKA